MLRNRYCTMVCLATAALAVAGLPSLAAAEAPEAIEKPKIDVSYIPPSAVAAVAAYPRSVLLSKDMEFLPREVFSASGIRDYGIDPVEVEQVLFVAEPPSSGPPQMALVVRLTKAIALESVLPILKPALAGPIHTDGKLDGKSYRKAINEMFPSIYPVDERTLIIGTDTFLRKIVANHAAPKASKLSAMVARVGTPDIVAVVMVEPLRPALSAMAAQQHLPPPFANVAKLPDLVQYVAAKIDLTGDMNMMLTICANDENAARQIASTIDGALLIAKQAAVELATNHLANSDAVEKKMTQYSASSDPVDKAKAQYVKRSTNRLCEMITPVQKGALLTVSGSGKENIQRILSAGITASLLTWQSPSNSAPFVHNIDPQLGDQPTHNPQPTTP